MPTLTLRLMLIEITGEIMQCVLNQAGQDKVTKFILEFCHDNVVASAFFSDAEESVMNHGFDGAYIEVNGRYAKDKQTRTLILERELFDVRATEDDEEEGADKVSGYWNACGYMTVMIDAAFDLHLKENTQGSKLPVTNLEEVDEFILAVETSLNRMREIRERYEFIPGCMEWKNN